MQTLQRPGRVQQNKGSAIEILQNSLSCVASPNIQSYYAYIFLYLTVKTINF